MFIQQCLGSDPGLFWQHVLIERAAVISDVCRDNTRRRHGLHIMIVLATMDVNAPSIFTGQLPQF